MMDKSATTGKKNLFPLRKKIRMGPEDRNDACNDENNVKKFIYEKKWKTKI